jgi:RNA polymerase sigma-B factor
MTAERSDLPDALRKFEEYSRGRDKRLRNELVEAHLGLAHQLARRFTHRGEPYDDLVQVASIALVKSVDRFDPTRGVVFATFATRTVIGELKRHFRDRGWTIRAPRRLQELYLALGPAIESLSQQLGRSPTVAEMADLVGADEESVLEALSAGQYYRPDSINAPHSEDDMVANQLGEVDPDLSSADDRLVVAISLTSLHERERTILALRFVDGLTESEIAARVNLSQMQVSRLLSSSLAQLRQSFIGEVEVEPGRS